MGRFRRWLWLWFGIRWTTRRDLERAADTGVHDLAPTRWMGTSPVCGDPFDPAATSRHDRKGR